MATHSFNTFLGALQSAVGQAQVAAATRHQAIVEQILEIGQDGALRAQSWVVHVPALPTGERRAGTVVLPLLTLRPLVLPQVTGFNLEVAVTLEREGQRFPSGLERMSLVIPRRLSGSRPGLRRLRVDLRGPQPGAGQVLMDGVVLRQLEGPVAPDTSPAPPPPPRPFFHRVLGFLFRLFPSRREPIRLWLSEEDTKRLREIQPPTYG